MATTSEWTVWVETTTDAVAATSDWTAWRETTTDPAPPAEFRKVRRAGSWVDITERHLRRSGGWT